MSCFKHPHFSDPETFLPIETALWWRDNAELFVRALLSPKYQRPSGYSSLSGNLIIYPPKCYIKDGTMNGRKPKGHVARLGDSDDKPVAFRWINISLTSEDVALLERETADLEQLALAFIELGVRGFGLSIKYDRSRKSYAVSIYGPDMANNMQPCGISGAAPDLRDAILVSLFRFNTGLQGSFDGCSLKNNVLQQARFK